MGIAQAEKRVTGRVTISSTHIWLISQDELLDQVQERRLKVLSKDIQDKGLTLKQFTPETLRTPAHIPQVILFYFPNFLPDEFDALRAKVAGLCSPYVPIMIGLFPKDFAAGDLRGLDTVLRAPAHSSQIIRRIDYLTRLKGIDRELINREQTLKRSFKLSPKTDELPAIRQLRCLFIGEATPAFLTIMNALGQQDVHIIAAFTSFTAFDYLHADKFDAVILNGIEDEEPALSVVQTMRRNSRLFSIPALLLTSGIEKEMSERYSKYGFGDIIDANAETGEIAGRIMELAGGHLMEDVLRARFKSLDAAEVLEPQTRLYSQDYFQEHLKRLRAVATGLDQPLTVGVLTLRALPGEAPSSFAFKLACIQVGALLRSLIRLQDFPARVSNNQFGIIFPDTDTASVEKVLSRLEQVIAATAFDNEENGSFTLLVETETISNQSADAEVEKAIA